MRAARMLHCVATIVRIYCRWGALRDVAPSAHRVCGDRRRGEAGGARRVEMRQGAVAAMRRLIGAQAEAVSPLSALPRATVAGRVYAIGDVHGRSDLLRRLLDQIYAEAAALADDLPISLVLLGDYIDRGEDSKGVLEMCRRLRGEAPVDDLVFLRGNHEEALLTFLEDPSFGTRWLSWGGIETLASYGVAAPLERARAEEFDSLRDDLRRAMGPDVSFLATQTLSSWRCGNVYFCHAAIDPELPLDQQTEKSLLWGDRRFLTRGGPDGVVVVHGHTVSEQPDVGRNRIGVDTGAYLSGRLTAVAIDQEGYRFLGA